MNEQVFGPVPSRRLGKSIGVNNIPHKVCSYSCTYCQVGKGDKIQIERAEFFKPDLLVEQVKQKLKNLTRSNYPDYITIVPDGEPTLDINLGELIFKLKQFDIPVAVITNSTLIHREDVKQELANADYISFKVDTTNKEVWKKINKPHKLLDLNQILSSISSFSNCYKGTLVTETMLVKGLNDSEKDIANVAQYLQTFKPNTSYISIPTRPPAFGNTLPPENSTLLKAHEIFYWYCLNVEHLTGYEGNAFASTGNFEEDILSITAVHPMRKDAVMELMAKTETSIDILNQLIENKQIVRIDYDHQIFYMRNFSGHYK